ncbi:related to methyltransferase [Fusarium mangiferae]|uniref:Related to methyltransferase n=1 Tax=Fusarium mangiferae TaxID=192010 RepID=A0A1L7U6E4_FUSMA|nr:uncharacterized protein FMAN_16005 [Fusarium mangiferae]CVL06338.1 related to methyltransferase [Fusarium mangiferae]
MSTVDITDDGDSSIETDAASSTTSISSSILNYRHENGRTYHRYKDGKYHLPNDQVENERLDTQHNLFLLTFGDELGLAPPNDPAATAGRVLDVGTGTGIWAIDYADEHLEAEACPLPSNLIKALGLYFSANISSVPPNLRFIIDDIDEDWEYVLRTGRTTSARSSSTSSIPALVRKTNLCSNLKPGGYVEFQETGGMILSDDGTLTPDHALSKWCNLLGEAFMKLGSTSIEFD